MAKKKNELEKLKIEDRIAMHRRMAESYRDAYLARDVKDGASYEEWKFADDAVYASPYFTGDGVISLGGMPVSVATYATMEAKAYSVTFPDWGLVDFKCWPADNGLVMKTRFEGHMKDGTKMSFYSIGFVETNDKGEITRWETHVNGEEFGPFLEVAIGLRGPFVDGHLPYLKRLGQVLKENGLSV